MEDFFKWGEGAILGDSGEGVQILTSAKGGLFKILFKYSFNFIGFSILHLDFGVLLTVHSIILIINHLNLVL
jgi:hypothetical protein